MDLGNEIDHPDAVKRGEASASFGLAAVNEEGGTVPLERVRSVKVFMRTVFMKQGEYKICFGSIEDAGGVDGGLGRIGIQDYCDTRQGMARAQWMPQYV